MDRKRLVELLERVARGDTSTAQALEALQTFPFEELPFATVDHHRQLRQGFPEVVLGERKSVDQIVSIVRALAAEGGNVLVTRVAPDKADDVVAQVRAAGHREVDYHEIARAVVLRQQPFEDLGRGQVVVVCAGTSDLPVAREAALTAELMGNRVAVIVDVGVAGIHRLMAHYETLRQAQVLVVVAGMEGALASVVGGLVSRPVVAVPTSVGYGAHLGGLAPLLTMLNSCAAGVTVVNIDNGFGAGFAASLINRKEPR